MSSPAGFQDFEAPVSKDPDQGDWEKRVLVLAQHFSGEWTKYGPYGSPSLASADSTKVNRLIAVLPGVGGRAVWELQPDGSYSVFVRATLADELGDDVEQADRRAQ